MFGVNWLYQALEQYDYITARSVFFKLISIVLMFLLVHQESDYRVYAAISVMASVGSNVLNFIRLRKFIKFKCYKDYNLKHHIPPINIIFAKCYCVDKYKFRYCDAWFYENG